MLLTFEFNNIMINAIYGDYQIATHEAKQQQNFP